MTVKFIQVCSRKTKAQNTLSLLLYRSVVKWFIQTLCVSWALVSWFSYLCVLYICDSLFHVIITNRHIIYHEAVTKTFHTFNCSSSAEESAYIICVNNENLWYLMETTKRLQINWWTSYNKWKRENPADQIWGEKTYLKICTEHFIDVNASIMNCYWKLLLEDTWHVTFSLIQLFKAFKIWIRGHIVYCNH